MVEQITLFFTALLGVALPEIVTVILAFALGYFLCRLFCEITRYIPQKSPPSHVQCDGGLAFACCCIQR